VPGLFFDEPEQHQPQIACAEDPPASSAPATEVTAPTFAAVTALAAGSAGCAAPDVSVQVSPKVLEFMEMASAEHGANS
jgi:hypothetical protein